MYGRSLRRNPEQKTIGKSVVVPLRDLFPGLSQGVGSYLFCSQSTAISVFSAAGVLLFFPCARPGIHTETHICTHTRASACACVSSEGVSRSKKYETVDSSHETSHNERI